jgi:histone H3/H4
MKYSEENIESIYSPIESIKEVSQDAKAATATHATDFVHNLINTGIEDIEGQTTLEQFNKNAAASEPSANISAKTKKLIEYRWPESEVEAELASFIAYHTEKYVIDILTKTQKIVTNDNRTRIREQDIETVLELFKARSHHPGKIPDKSVQQPVNEQ